MSTQTQTKPLPVTIQHNWLQTVAIIGLLFGLLTALFYNFPIGIDWKNAHHAAHDLRHYDRHAFIGIPLSLVFIPHVLLPIQLGNAINLALNVSVPMLVLYRYRAGLWAIGAVYLCPPFYVTLTTNNIEWLPLIGFLVPPMFGVALVALKPQALSGVLIVWIKRHGVKIIVPLLMIGVVILMVWGLTPLHVMRRAETDVTWNFAPWPFLIPVGIFLLWKAWREDDEFIAAAATPLLVPYIAGYTLPVTICVLACKYPKLAFAITVGLWWLLVVETRRYG